MIRMNKFDHLCCFIFFDRSIFIQKCAVALDFVQIDLDFVQFAAPYFDL